MVALTANHAARRGRGDSPILMRSGRRRWDSDGAMERGACLGLFVELVHQQDSYCDCDDGR